MTDQDRVAYQIVTLRVPFDPDHDDPPAMWNWVNVIDACTDDVTLLDAGPPSDEPTIPDPEVVRVIFTEGDVRGMVEAHNDDEDFHDPVDVDRALERAHEWGKHIADTACSLVSEQLESVIIGGQP